MKQKKRVRNWTGEKRPKNRCRKRGFVTVHPNAATRGYNFMGRGSDLNDTQKTGPGHDQPNEGRAKCVGANRVTTGRLETAGSLGGKPVLDQLNKTWEENLKAKKESSNQRVENCNREFR